MARILARFRRRQAATCARSPPGRPT